MPKTYLLTQNDEAAPCDGGFDIGLIRDADEAHPGIKPVFAGMESSMIFKGVDLMAR